LALSILFRDIARRTLPTLALSSLSAVSSHAFTLGWNTQKCILYIFTAGVESTLDAAIFGF